MASEIIKVSRSQDETAVFTDVDTFDEHFGELYAHFVHEEDVITKVLMGLPVTAYCGFTWVPTRFIDHGELPLCPDCREAFAARGRA